ncbi:MAG: hypothetical protein DKINENOH_01105 [bacterium]|nr:hypothetical protein [bacterium]
MMNVLEQHEKVSQSSKPRNARVVTRCRILHVVPHSTRGGIFRVAVDLFHSFAQDDAFALAAAVPASRGEEESFPFAGKYVILEGSPVQQFLALKRMAQQSEVIHLHGFTPWQALACWLARKRIVYTNHGLLGTGRKLRPHERLKLVLLKLFLRHAVHRIAHVSRFMQARMISEYAVPAPKCRVVYNSTSWQAQPPHFNPTAKLCIGFHGRFVSFKRIDRLLRVAALVAQHRGVEVVLVGGGPLQNEITAQAASLHVPLRLESYTLQVEALVSTFDVEIIASQDEPFGLSVLESIQTGHPTFVFTDGGGCTEIFEAETSWFVCRSETEMAKKILSLQDDGTGRDVLNLLEKLQQRIHREFSRVKFRDGYRAVYQELLAQK